MFQEGTATTKNLPNWEMAWDGKTRTAESHGESSKQYLLGHNRSWHRGITLHTKNFFLIFYDRPEDFNNDPLAFDGHQPSHFHRDGSLVSIGFWRGHSTSSNSFMIIWQNYSPFSTIKYSYPFCDIQFCTIPVRMISLCASKCKMKSFQLYQIEYRKMKCRWERRIQSTGWSLEVYHSDSFYQCIDIFGMREM